LAPIFWLLLALAGATANRSARWFLTLLTLDNSQRWREKFVVYRALLASTPWVVQNTWGCHGDRP
jgi:hypothetical protein